VAKQYARNFKFDMEMIAMITCWRHYKVTKCENWGKICNFDELESWERNFSL